MTFKVGDTVRFAHQKSVGEARQSYARPGAPGWVWDMNEEYLKLQAAGLLTVCDVCRIAGSGDIIEDAIQVYPLNHPEQSSFWYSASDFRIAPVCTTEIV